MGMPWRPSATDISVKAAQVKAAPTRPPGHSEPTTVGGDETFIVVGSWYYCDQIRKILKGGKTMSINMYEIVTERILAELEKGSVPWQKPWSGVAGGAISRTTGKPYSMLNQWMLSQTGEYLTFRQVQAEGGKVRKGSKAEMVVFFKPFKVNETDRNGTQVEKTIPLLRYYNVFHIDQCEGIFPKYTTVPDRSFDPIEEAESICSEFCKREDLTITHALQDRAFYSPMADTITLPLKEQFSEVAEYYSTLFHELGHSTGVPKRLGRFQVDSVLHQSKEEYSQEELVAEIASATILSTLGIETKGSFENAVAYIDNWIQALKNDRRMIVTAASKAEKAVGLIMGGKEAPSGEEEEQ
jgi:antirestriction protein ArdC